MKQASLFLNTILNHTHSVKSTCGKRIYPLVAPAGVPGFPFATYEHQSRPGNGTKDGTKREIYAIFSIVGRTALEVEDIADGILPSMYSYCEDPDLNDFSEVFSEPDFEKEEEVYDDRIDAYIVRVHINFETI